MITIITRWETSQMPAQVEWQMWRQLRGAYSITRLCFTPRISEMDNRVEQFDSLEDALATGKGKRVFLEPTGQRSISEIPKGDIVLILGDTETHNIHHARPEEMYSIKAVSPKTHLYGINAAAIALAYRHGQ